MTEHEYQALGQQQDQEEADWQEYLRGLPAQHRLDLNAPWVVQAFRKARQRGWSVQELIADAAKTLRSGASVGLVINRLRGRGQTSRPVDDDSPPEREHPSSFSSKRVQRHAFIPLDANGWFCLECQLPPHNRAHAGYPVAAPAAPEQVTPPGQVAERITLLEQIGRGGYSPDGAEDAMRKLIAHQNNPTSTPDDPWGAL